MSPMFTISAVEKYEAREHRERMKSKFLDPPERKKEPVCGFCNGQLNENDDCPACTKADEYDDMHKCDSFDEATPAFDEVKA